MQPYTCPIMDFKKRFTLLILMEYKQNRPILTQIHIIECGDSMRYENIEGILLGTFLTTVA